MSGAEIVAVSMEHLIPAGALGPKAFTLDVRAYLVPHLTGMVLIDTGMEPTGEALTAALSTAGAEWSDVSDVMITHAHPDHIGALDAVRASAPQARVHAHPSEAIPGAHGLGEGDCIGSLRVIATPGHTPGHISLIDEREGVLLVGDCLGVVEGALVRAPDMFTANARTAEQSLHRLRDVRATRMLFAHGPN